jgi:hypothetical protein
MASRLSPGKILGQVGALVGITSTTTAGRGLRLTS